MLTYQELQRENDYLKNCLALDDYVYAVCIAVSNKKVYTLGCVKFLNGIDHWRTRDKMFSNIPVLKYWALVDKSVYENSNKGSDKFTVNGSI